MKSCMGCVWSWCLCFQSGARLRARAGEWPGRARQGRQLGQIEQNSKCLTAPGCSIGKFMAAIVANFLAEQAGADANGYAAHRLLSLESDVAHTFVLSGVNRSGGCAPTPACAESPLPGRTGSVITTDIGQTVRWSSLRRSCGPCRRVLHAVRHLPAVAGPSSQRAWFSSVL